MNYKTKPKDKMTEINTQTAKGENAVIEIEDVDYSELVGKPIKIRCQQFPGKVLQTKIVGVSGQSLLIDRSGSSGMVDQLINNQPVTIYIEYKGEPVSFESKINIPHKGRLQIPIVTNFVPELNREFPRIPLNISVRLACFNNLFISTGRLNKLKWIETMTHNISGGGILVQVPSELTNDFYMIINLELEKQAVPKLILGRVRHCYSSDDNKFAAGVQFITRENHRQLLPKELVRNLPTDLFKLSDQHRQRLAALLENNMEIELI